MRRKRSEKGVPSFATQHILIVLALISLAASVYFFIPDNIPAPPRHSIIFLENMSNLLATNSGLSDTFSIAVPDLISNIVWQNCIGDTDLHPTSQEDARQCKTSCMKLQILYNNSYRQDHIQFPLPTCGDLSQLYFPGIHFLTLSNDNGTLRFVRCGDGFVSGYEQCEPCEHDNDCASGSCLFQDIDALLGTGEGVCATDDHFFTTDTCSLNGYTLRNCHAYTSPFACFCSCTDDNQCPTGKCDQVLHVCSFCYNDEECSSGVCVQGNCQQA